MYITHQEPNVGNIHSTLMWLTLLTIFIYHIELTAFVLRHQQQHTGVPATSFSFSNSVYFRF